MFFEGFALIFWDAVPNPARGMIPLDPRSQHHIHGVARADSKGRSTAKDKAAAQPSSRREDALSPLAECEAESHEKKECKKW